MISLLLFFFILLVPFSTKAIDLPLRTEGEMIVNVVNVSSSPAVAIFSLYNFALGIGAMAAFGIIVYAALRYTATESASVRHDAQGKIFQALIGLLLLLGASMVLRFINPVLPNLTDPRADRLRDLQTITTIPSQPGGFGTSGDGSTYPPRAGGRCSGMSAGPASGEALQRTCFGANALQASGIAQEESHGNTLIRSGVDYCNAGGGRDSVSWGLFQINITVHKFDNYVDPDTGRVENLDCPKAFNMPYTGASSRDQCRVVNRILYNRCVKAAQNPDINIRTACKISQNGTKWGQWGANRICGFPR